MNKHLILFLMLTLCFMGCSQKDSDVTKIIIAGKVENTTGESIDVYLEEEVGSSVFEEDGTFYLSFDAEEEGVYFIRAGVGDFSLFLTPGDSVFVTADGQEFKNSFQLSGNRVAESNYLHQKNLFLYEELGDMFELFSLPREAYLDKRSRFFIRQKERFNQYQAEHKLHPVFIKEEEAYLEFEPFLYDSQYPHYQAYINEINLEDVDFPLEETKAAFDAIDLGRSDFLVSRTYRSIVDRRVHEHAMELVKRDSTLSDEKSGIEQAVFMAADELLQNKAVKDHFMYNFIKSNMGAMGPVYVEDAYEKFLAENNSPKLVTKLEKAKAKWEPIMPGKEIPDFKFIDVEGDSVKLSDLRGKLVYIDIWATWCGPCIAEHPHWDELRAAYNDKDVAFLSLSIDDTKEPWEKMVKSKNMGGYQWFAENAWKSEITRLFMVNSIPRFLLLDKEGKIINPSAERPSGGIREHLDKYLES
jgi:thiol-disulfide isomerase/thioredoxin